MSHAILQQLCDLRGIQSDFVDAWGNPAKVSDESKIKMLAAYVHSLGGGEDFATPVTAPKPGAIADARR